MLLKESKHMKNNYEWARIRHDAKGWWLELCENKSPLALVMDKIGFATKQEAEHAMDIYMKQTGKTYGGRQW